MFGNENEIEVEEGAELTAGEVWRRRLQRLRTRVRSGAPFVLGVLAALVAFMIYGVLAPAPHQLTASEVSDTVANAMASATPRPAFSEQVYQAVLPALVLVEAQSPAASNNGKPDESLGSGVVVDDAGDILTSLHVVASADTIQVTFADGTQSNAEVAIRQPVNDIAVLRADNPPAQIVPATLGNPNSLRPGDEAYAVGNPFGLYGSMSAGVVSGLGRSFQPVGSDQELKNLIQIDAAVNPGNSGGPLLNRYGQVVGIVVGILNPTDQRAFIGIGFAVPIDLAGGALGSPPD